MILRLFLSSAAEFLKNVHNVARWRILSRNWTCSFVLLVAALENPGLCVCWSQKNEAKMKVPQWSLSVSKCVGGSNQPSRPANSMEQEHQHLRAHYSEINGKATGLCIQHLAYSYCNMEISPPCSASSSNKHGCICIYGSSPGTRSLCVMFLLVETESSFHCLSLFQEPGKEMRYSQTQNDVLTAQETDLLFSFTPVKEIFNYGNWRSNYSSFFSFMRLW